MHAYAAAFGVDRLALIYPAVTAAEGAAQTEFALPSRGAERPILSVACIDVHRDHLPFITGAESLLLQRAPP